MIRAVKRSEVCLVSVPSPSDIGTEVEIGLRWLARHAKAAVAAQAFKLYMGTFMRQYKQ